MWDFLKFLVVIVLIIIAIAILLSIGAIAFLGNVLAQILSLPLSCIIALVVLVVSVGYIIFGD